MRSSRPDYEKRRLQALARYRILDTAPEQAYDDITRLASSICRTPVAFISLVDEHRQWFKAKIGVDAKETPREIAFCNHTIMGRDILVVPDAFEDERFADSPLARNAPYIRFYAGVPLVTPEGDAVGALCAVDREPRGLPPEQAEALRALGRQVVQLLELRRASAELASALTELKTLKGLLPICSYCRRVRDDSGAWSELELYVERCSHAEFTHGICPRCSTTLLADSGG